MKRQKGSKTSEDQEEKMEYLESCGYTCIVAKGALNAEEQTIEFYRKRDK
jgi:hypothetical protein